MALKPCRECEKQVSDQADICPNCGIKEPTISVEIALPSQTGEDSDVILTMPGILITRTLAKFPSQTFPINGIGSVTLAPPSRGAWIGGAVICGFIAIMIFAGASSGDDGSGAAVGFIFLIVGIIFGFVAHSKEPGLLIKTASGDVRAMEGEEKTLEIVKQAIERAATMRG